MVVYPWSRLGEGPEITPESEEDPYGNPDPEPAWMSIDWRERLDWVDLDGTAVNFASIGEGEPVVFVHGLGGCWQNWLENMPAFAASGYRAIALDLPGFGHSPVPEWELTIPNYGELLDGFCRKLGIEGATVVGNSMGGFVAAEAAIGRPAWLERLVLVSAAGISHAEMTGRPQRAVSALLAQAAPLALRLQDATIRRPGLRSGAFAGTFHKPLAIRPELLWEFLDRGIDPPGFLGALAGMLGYDILDRLEEVEAPTLLIWGRNDRIVPAVDAPGYQERISHAELVVFDECGHVPMAERPVRFNRVVERFIRTGSALEAPNVPEPRS